MKKYYIWKYGVSIHFPRWDFYLSYQPGYSAEKQYGAGFHGLSVCVFCGLVLKVLHPY
jgi:hypothetical protein